MGWLYLITPDLLPTRESVVSSNSVTELLKLIRTMDVCQNYKNKVSRTFK